MKEYTIKVYEIEKDGIPNMEDDDLAGRRAFIWNGAIVSGWPLDGIGMAGYWEPSEDRFGKPVSGVTHWIELSVAAHELKG